jgi:putrescine transport system ATP-binding protein
VTSPATAGGFLRLEDVVKSFDGVVAVDGVSLDIAQGEIFALLGSSGCGKTTLLRMVAGFESPTSGRILLEGRDLVGLAPYQRPLNMMFQSYALFPHLSVADNVAFGLKRAGMPSGQIGPRVESLLKLVQLSRLAQRKPHQLSGGQQQRVALARSLARQPRLLLLDEPLGALDRKLREETRIELANIIRQVGVTCLLVTHDQEEAMTMASRMAVMHEGRLMQVGTPKDIYSAPTSRFVADFIGNVNLIDGRVDTLTPGEMAVSTADAHWVLTGGPRFSVGKPVTLALRPEQIQLSRQPPKGPGVNAARATVQGKAYFGSFTLYQLRLNSGAMLKVAPAHVDGPSELEAACGEEVWAHWPASAPVALTS